MPQPPPNGLIDQILINIGSCISGIIGTLFVSKATMYSIITTRMSALEQRADDMETKMAQKEREVISAKAETARANAMIDFLKLEIKEIRWRYSQLSEVFLSFLNRLKLPIDEKNELIAIVKDSAQHFETSEQLKNKDHQ